VRSTFPARDIAKKSLRQLNKFLTRIRHLKVQSKRGNSGIQSNLAVSEAGSSIDESKTNSAKNKNQVDKPKKKLTNQAIQNNKSNTGMQSNLAVSNAGSPADNVPKKQQTTSTKQDTLRKTITTPTRSSPY
jgi:hypothetical protein